MRLIRTDLVQNPLKTCAAFARHGVESQRVVDARLIEHALDVVGSVVVSAK